MPLITANISATLAENQQAIGFWMIVQGATPAEQVRVFVTFEALAQIDPTKPRDAAAAFATFDKNRPLIETAASEKFDRQEIEDVRHEGKQVVRVNSNDL